MMRRTRAGDLVACGLALITGGCAPSGDLTIPDKPLPSKFANQSGAPSIATMNWREYFEDTDLATLIQDALAGNPDVFIALQRLESFRARVQHATGATLPQLAASVRAGLSKPGRYTAEGAGNASTEIRPGQLTPTPVGEFALGVQASWEIDAWGKLANRRRSAIAEYLASIEGLHLVRTSLIAEVARAYFELLALDHKRIILLQTIERQDRALEVVRLQKEAGRANELAVQQFAAQLASTQSLEANLSLAIRSLENEVNRLRGSYPRVVRRSWETLLRAIPGDVGGGIPSALLQNRPDVRQAERQLESTKFDVKAARAAFYPSLDVSAAIGLEAFNPKFLFELPGSVAYSATAGLIAPLVNRAAIEAEFNAAKAAQLEAMYNYQKVVLSAYVEVANGLLGLEAKAKVISLKKGQRAAVEQTVATADALYRAGKASYVEVLLAEQNSLSADLELVDAMLEGHLARVEIYRALGGGWN